MNFAWNWQLIFFRIVLYGLMFIPFLGRSPNIENLELITVTDFRRDWYFRLNSIDPILASTSKPPICKKILSYRERSITDSFPSSVSILALMKLFILTFSARNLVSIVFSMQEPVTNVRFLIGCFRLEKCCVHSSSFIVVALAFKLDDWLHVVLAFETREL